MQSVFLKSKAPENFPAAREALFVSLPYQPDKGAARCARGSRAAKTTRFCLLRAAAGGMGVGSPE